MHALSKADISQVQVTTALASQVKVTGAPSQSQVGATARQELTSRSAPMTQSGHAGAHAGSYAYSAAHASGPLHSSSIDGADRRPCIEPGRHRELPPFSAVHEPQCDWGNLDGASFSQAIHAAHAEVVHWRRNIFLVPSGEQGKGFVTELARLFQAYAEGSSWESFALTAAMTMPSLLLQKPHPQSTAKDHVACLQRRMNAWKSGDIDGLLRECRAIQHHLQAKSSADKDDDSVLRGFTRLMLRGNVKGAIRVLSNSKSGGVLPLSSLVDSAGKSVKDVLREKHPPAAKMCREAVVDVDYSGSSSSFHPVLFEGVTASAIRSAALRTEGSAGPSGIDAAGWRRLCTSFHGASNSLCSSIASMTRRLCTEYVDPSSLSAFIACRLIPLDKCPGVRPIGVCETVRRIVGKAIATAVSSDIRTAAGPLQQCAGQPAGSEAAIHSMAKIFFDAGSDAVLLVDATNAFNSLNRKVALLNIQVLCPALAPFLTNIYRTDCPLFVGGEVLYSSEGTTQGDPLAMAMFAIAIRPLIDRLATAKALQVWFADDAAGGGTVLALRRFWDLLLKYGPFFGYNANATKTWLLVKEDSLTAAEDAFGDAGIKITTSGVRHLGAPLGNREFVENYVSEQVNCWVNEMKELCKIANAQPHLAFCALTQGLLSKWTYLTRTVNDVDMLLQPLEEIIRKSFLPALTGRSPPDDTIRRLFSLPPRLGGLGVINPSEMAAINNKTSMEVTKPIVELILSQHQNTALDLLDSSLAEQRAIMPKMRKLKNEELNTKQMDICSKLPPPLQQPVACAKDLGASSWLAARPIESHGFALHKGAFRDALALRYGWEPINLPAVCACGASFDSSHALSCQKGGFTITRHNEIRDFTAKILSEVCHDVEVEPKLQPLSGEQLQLASANRDPNARLDVKARGLWGGVFECAFFDVRIINPRAHSNQTSSTTTAYRRHEQAKRREYEQRVRDVEMASFTPLVFSASGGFGPAASTAFKRIASLLARKWDMPYSVVMGWLRVRTSFALLRSSIMCLRGSRQHTYGRVTRPELAVAEGRFNS